MRPSREQIFMEVAHAFARRSTCLRGQVGSVLVVDSRIVATAYNGAPPGLPQCDEVGCLPMADPFGAGRAPETLLGAFGCQRAIHSEANVIAFAAKHGVRTQGAVLYNTHGPCPKCAQLIVAAGIVSVVFEHVYRLPEGLDLLRQADLALAQWDPGENRAIKEGDYVSD